MIHLDPAFAPIVPKLLTCCKCYIAFSWALFQSQCDLINCHNQLKYRHWHCYYLAHLPDLSRGIFSANFVLFINKSFLILFIEEFSFSTFFPKFNCSSFLLTSTPRNLFLFNVWLTCVRQITRQSPWAKNQTPCL